MRAAQVTSAQGAREREYDAVGNLTKGESLVGELGPGRPGVVSRRFDGDRNLSAVTLAQTVGGALILHGELAIEHRSEQVVRRRHRVERLG